MSKNQPPASFLPAAAKKESNSEGYRNSTNSCNIQTADAQDQLPVQEVC